MVLCTYTIWLTKIKFIHRSQSRCAERMDELLLSRRLPTFGRAGSAPALGRSSAGPWVALGSQRVHWRRRCRCKVLELRSALVWRCVRPLVASPRSHWRSDWRSQLPKGWPLLWPCQHGHSLLPYVYLIDDALLHRRYCLWRVQPRGLCCCWYLVARSMLISL